MNDANFKLPSGKELVVLELLSNKMEMYGLEMVKESSELKRGTVYVLLDRMEDKGLIKSRKIEDDNTSGLPRRVYSLTGLGQRVYLSWQQAQSVFAEGGVYEGT